jgi:hypothetical protein
MFHKSDVYFHAIYTSTMWIKNKNKDQSNLTQWLSANNNEKLFAEKTGFLSLSKFFSSQNNCFFISWHVIMFNKLNQSKFEGHFSQTSTSGFFILFHLKTQFRSIWPFHSIWRIPFENEHRFGSTFSDLNQTFFEFY